jgi:hypothetical protein
MTDTCDLRAAVLHHATEGILDAAAEFLWSDEVRGLALLPALMPLEEPPHTFATT